MTQKVNQPVSTDINVELMNIIQSYRYNHSNWLYYAGEDENDYSTDRSNNKFLLSTYTKRFMIMFTRIAKHKDYSDTDPEDRKDLPLFKVKVNCFIDGDYRHSITQTNGNGYKQIEGGALYENDYKVLYYSYVIFDFNTANEIKNSITVTDLNKVPTKGLFTLEILDEDDKAISYIPHQTSIRFSMIGSGLDTSNYTPPVKKSQVDDYTFNIIKDITIGNMIGYTRAPATDFELDNGEDYPKTQYHHQNIVIPTSPISIPEITDDIYLSYNNPQANPTTHYFNENVMNSCDKECILLCDTPDLLFTSSGYSRPSVSTGRFIDLSNRCGSDVIMMKWNNEWVCHMNVTTPFTINVNNMLLLEKQSNQYKNDEYVFFIDENSPLILPQIQSSTSDDRAFDEGIINFIHSYYKRWCKNLDYTLMCDYKKSSGNEFAYLWINEIPTNVNFSCYNSDVLDTYDIKIESWNSDSNHNIYLNFVF